MFETLFRSKAVVCRHREGPLSAERAAYLEELAAQGMARGTLLHRASYCLCVAVELQRWSPNHCFEEEEVSSLAAAWAAKRVATGRASDTKWPKAQFRFAATDFLRNLGRLRLPLGPEGRYDREVTDFIAAQQEGRWPSAATCRSARWQVTRFLEYLEQRGVALAALVPADIDGYFLHMAQRWSRNSLRTAAKMLRAWFAHCEKRGYLRAGLADAVLLPRIYQQEGLPIGPTWDEIGRTLSSTAGNDPASVRDHAVLLLLSVYGLRSGEVRRLQLENLDWSSDQIRIVRSKSGRKETLPIEPRVGNAIMRYLRQARPKADSRALFLTLRAPHRPLSAGGLYNIVRHHLSKVSSPTKGRGPHGLRHACARHLLNAGRTFKEVGDHLGHRSPDATRIYAKIDLSALRRVAFNDLGGLA
jgi:integrase/recombinase XerD